MKSYLVEYIHVNTTYMYRIYCTVSFYIYTHVGTWGPNMYASVFKTKYVNVLYDLAWHCIFIIEIIVPIHTIFILCLIFYIFNVCICTLMLPIILYACFHYKAVWGGGCTEFETMIVVTKQCGFTWCGWHCSEPTQSVWPIEL